MYSWLYSHPKRERERKRNIKPRYELGIANPVSSTQINISNCTLDEDAIMVEVPRELDIRMEMQGGCVFLTGSASVSAYRDIILSARSGLSAFPLAASLMFFLLSWQVHQLGC